MTPSPPIQPRIDLLPLDAEEWEWKRFERFCVAFVKALPDVRHAYLYGQPGEDQAGIDVVADLVDGRTRVYQCRKRKAFGPKAVEKTIAETEFEADEYVIAVTRKVSRQVRDLVRKQPGWELLDKEDICQVLRADINRERARNIVKTRSTSPCAERFSGRQVRSCSLSPSGTSLRSRTSRRFFGGS